MNRKKGSVPGLGKTGIEGEAPSRNARGEVFMRSEKEASDLDDLGAIAMELFPKFGENWNVNALATIRRQTLSRVLYYDMLYRQIVGKPGVICEFGVQWGATLALLANLRGIHEPFHHNRKIIGFDTFAGFSELSEEDGAGAKPGDYSVDAGYEATLARIMEIHEANAPLPHIRKFELVKGDASETAPRWLSDNPHAAIAMAIFDMDLYRPTRDVLEAIKPRLFRGSLLVFDEFSCKNWPGETLAADEILGLNNLALRHDPNQPNCAWAVFGES